MRKTEDVAFDLERAVRCADDYSRSTGIRCAVIDQHGRLLHTVGGSVSCRFCLRMQEFLDKSISCEKVHLYGAYQSERFGGKYVYFCPSQVVHWATPIMVDGIMRGAFLGGPALMIDRDEFLVEEVLSRNGIPDQASEMLRKDLVEIPVVPPDRVESMSELLFIVGLHVSDADAEHALTERDYLDQQSRIAEYIHHIKTIGGDDEALPSYPIAKERELLHRIAVGDKAGAQETLNEILGHVFFASGRRFEVIKARVLELIVILSRAALEGGADLEVIFGLNYKYLRQIHEFQSVDDLAYWLSRIMLRFTDLVFNLNEVKHVDVIFRAVDYIKRHYSRKITLEEVADHVRLSPAYFSKIFKQEMGSNFSVYLNQVRVQQSQRLMQDPSASLADIAQLVGFEDQSYFSKVFKRLTGVSPGRYRESRGQVRRNEGVTASRDAS